MIEITNLTKKTGRAIAIDNMTFSVRPRECLGLFGHDGAGKSTLLKLLSGAIPATSGNIKIHDIDIATHPIQAKKIIGYQPEFALSHSNMKVKSFLGFMAEVRGLRGLEKRKMVDRAITRLELWRVLDSPVAALPQGTGAKSRWPRPSCMTPSCCCSMNPQRAWTPCKNRRSAPSSSR